MSLLAITAVGMKEDATFLNAQCSQHVISRHLSSNPEQSNTFVHFTPHFAVDAFYMNFATVFKINGRVEH